MGEFSNEGAFRAMCRIGGILGGRRVRGGGTIQPLRKRQIYRVNDELKLPKLGKLEHFSKLMPASFRR